MEEKVYKAKVWMRSWADAVNCLQQSARKQATFSQYKTYYLQIKEPVEGEGLPSKEESLQLFKFTQNLIKEYLTPEPANYQELMQTLDAFIQNNSN
mmetsp:Transcript_13519/g.19746  ORF Transcript_13519/g.19746 Transcript_13519/m.19746 type:complete len:96 (+) Transcript_13519:1433-1720(+)